MRCNPPHPPVVPELICLAQGMTPHGLSCSTYRALVGLAMTTHPVRSHFGRSANVVAVSERAFFSIEQMRGPLDRRGSVTR